MDANEIQGNFGVNSAIQASRDLLGAIFQQFYKSCFGEMLIGGSDLADSEFGHAGK